MAIDRPGSHPNPFPATLPSDNEAQVAEKIVHITDDTFETEVLQSQTPVLVDYWAEWCGPCKMIAPTLAEIADEQRGKLAIAKLNVDDNPDTARRYDVMSIPTLLVFENGEQVKRIAMSDAGTLLTLGRGDSHVRLCWQHA